jgi:hypothetical protein
VTIATAISHRVPEICTTQRCGRETSESSRHAESGGKRGASVRTLGRPLPRRQAQVPAVVAERHPDIGGHAPGVVALTDSPLDAAETMLAVAVATFDDIAGLESHQAARTSARVDGRLPPMPRDYGGNVDINVQSRRFDEGGQELQPGAEWSRPPLDLLFNVRVRCVAVNPDRFVGIVTLMDEVIVETKPYETLSAAADAARDALHQRVAKLLR